MCVSCFVVLAIDSWLRFGVVGRLVMVLVRFMVMGWLLSS